MHELSAGSEIRWDAPPVGHAAFVWSGEAEVAGAKLPKHGALVVEHNGSAVLRAGPSGAVFAHFHSRDEHPVKPARTGGHVHVEGSEGISKSAIHDTEYTLWADSACPTCEIWLVRGKMPRAHPDVGRHYHSADEIILVTDGRMLLGRRSLTAGSAIAVDADTIYTFGTPPEGLGFLNFRADDSSFVKVDKKNAPLHAPISDYILMFDRELQRFSTGQTRSAEEYAAAGLAPLTK